MKIPLASILINNYNYGRFVGDAIRSALAQTYPNVEVIVVDDGSTDDSREVISEFGDKVKAIFKSNGGQNTAVNAAFAAAQGDYLFLLDADDWAFPERVACMVRHYLKHPDVGWGFHAIEFRGIRGELNRIEPVASSGRYDLRSEVQQGYIKLRHPATSGLSFRKATLSQILPMPESEDFKFTVDNYLKFASNILSPGYFESAPLGVLRLHGENNYTDIKSMAKQGRNKCSTAFWLRKNFPELARFADNHFAHGLALLFFVPIEAFHYREKLFGYFQMAGLEAYGRIFFRMARCGYLILLQATKRFLRPGSKGA